MNTHYSRLALLREAMNKNKIDVYIIPTGDPHLGEYIPDHWRIIPWLTGFTGSSATVVVTDTFAGLWTDSRYFVQAASQLQDTGFRFIKPDISNKNDFADSLYEIVKDKSSIGFDGRTISVSRMRRIEDALESKKVIFITDSDLISEIWTDRPPMSDSHAYEFPVIYAGKESSVKITEVRERMRKRKINYHLLTSLDDIMWLLNIRGDDVNYSPLLTSFAIIGEEQVLLFVDESRIPYKLAVEFDKLGVVMLPYEETSGMLSTIPAGSSVLLSPVTTSVSLFNSIPDGIKIIEDFSIPGRLKAVKNKVEIANIGQAMIKDGIALTKFFCWLEQNSLSLVNTELFLVERLNLFRFEQAGYIGPSFAPIVAYNEHSALPHYSPSVDSDLKIGPAGILLVDSGGQYFNGTTDITRTISLGSPTPGQIRDYTLVLKGNIALAMAKMPSGSRGIQLDILARKALWESGLNYGHGTGHGVGFCLNVHEGPQSISPAESPESKTVIESGMLISNEPAIYREGEYGIRIENLILCYEDEETEFGQFLRFDTVSLCYIDASLIDKSLLDRKEIEWLNNYHAGVYEKLNRFLTDQEKEWLREKTAAI
jgi:Xaa-Pro aminopeptidase